MIRPLALPPGREPPTLLRHAELCARPLGRTDLAEDLRAVNASVELIRRTRGGSWPAGPLDAEYDVADLIWHEVEFRERTSFAYAVRDAGGSYVGCCYLYPPGRRAPLAVAALERHDVDVSWWVTPEAYARGLYRSLYEALRVWVAEGFGFTDPYWSNRQPASSP